jgi:hypothetical protein
LDFYQQEKEGFSWKTLMTKYRDSEILVKKINARRKFFRHVLAVPELPRFHFPVCQRWVALHLLM